MSTSTGQIRCHGCQYQGVLQHRSVVLRYALPDGTKVDSHRTFGWCNDCRGIRDVESKLDVSALRLELERLNPRQRSLGSFFKSSIDRALGGGTDDDQIERQRLMMLLRVAELRKSPPRCLSCGSTSVSPSLFDADGNSQDFVHSCGSRLYRVPPDPNAPRFSYRPEVLPLDIEGHRLDRKPDHFTEFLTYLTKEWHFKDRYAQAFLSAYRADISALHDDGLARLDASFDLSKPENRLLAHQMPDPRAFALVGQAYRAYLADLSQGKHLGTDVEVAIWAILWNRTDLLSSVDKPLAEYIERDPEQKFAQLFDVAFEEYAQSDA